MSKLFDYRTCPTTGLKVDRAAEKLIRQMPSPPSCFLRSVARPDGRTDALASGAFPPGRLVLPGTYGPRL